MAGKVTVSFSGHQIFPVSVESRGIPPTTAASHEVVEELEDRCCLCAANRVNTSLKQIK